MAEIHLTQGKIALVDEDDFPELSQWKWHLHRSKLNLYARRDSWVDGKRVRIYMHHHIAGGAEVDHEDGNGLNNVRSNLRTASRSENMCNRGKQSNNKSGFKGVSWHKARGRWRAQIQVNRKSHYLGSYTTAESAGAAYEEAAKRLHGEFARTDDLQRAA